MTIRPFDSADQDAVIALWQACDLVRPQNDPAKDIARKLRVDSELFLVGVEEGAIVATVIAGYEGHRGWINYLAVHPSHRKKGLGRQMMSAAQSLLEQRGCPKINLQVRSSNSGVIEFYRRIGYSVEDVVSLGKRLSRD